MRNLKKVLAMALALVMSLSLVTIANAADFSDDADISYKEAVDVMSAIGVINGYEDGSFQPDGILTREEAAKLICTMLLGDSADRLGTTSSSFTDVAATRWSSPFIEYCNSLGIIAGNGDGTFDPTGELTGHAFAKMLLVALGYDSAREGYTGAGWSIEVAKDAVTAGIDVDGVALSAPVSREVAAQMSFNTLQATMVEYATAGTVVTTPDGTTVVTSGSNASKVEDENNRNDYDSSADGYVQFCEQYFDDLEKDTAVGVRDDLGRPAHKWTYPNGTTEVGTYADEADYVVIATKAYAGLNALYQDEVDEDYPDDSIAYQRINGRQWTNGDQDSNNNWIASGDVVEYYLNDNGVITSAVTLRYSVGKVADVNTRVTSSDRDDGVTAYVRIENLNGNTEISRVKDTEFAGFNYDEDDVILYVASGTEILASELADSVTGEVTAIRGGDEARIDGTYYKFTGVKVDNGDEGTFYLNKAGQIMAADATSTKSDNYIWLYAIDGDYTRNSDGIRTAVFTGYGVLTDGTKVTYEIATEADGSDYYFEGADHTSDNKLGSLSSENVTVSKNSAVIAYSVNSDGQLVYEDAADTIKWQSTHDPVDKENAQIGDAYATSDTVFIFGDIDDTSVDVSLSTGYRNVDIQSSASLTTIADEDGNVLYVFVKAANGTLSSDDMYAVLLDEDAVVTREDGDTFYTYTVYADGEETELTWKTGSDPLSGYTLGDVFKYNMDGEYVKSGSVSKQTATTVSAASGDYVITQADQYNLDDATIHTITREYDGNDVDTVDVYEGGSIEADDSVILVVDGSDVVTAFVYDDIK